VKRSAQHATPSTVVVFGAYGLLGATLCPVLSNFGYHVLKQSRGNIGDVCCNPTDMAEVAGVLNSIQPVAVINLVALSNVDVCEADLPAAFVTNVRSVEVLVSAIEKTESIPHLIHISTDHVYKGVGPHVEGSVSPINNYALTKYTSELLALQVGASIFRTNFIGKSRSDSRQSFTDWIFQSLVGGRYFTVFDDVFFSALSMQTLSICVAKALEVRLAGVFNVGTRDGISKASFAQKFASSLGLNTDMMRIGSVLDMKLSAPRPTDMRLNVRRFENAFGIDMPDMDKEIQKVADEYRGEMK
jgi:dTDP-4-dehydrorhamnose reductase